MPVKVPSPPSLKQTSYRGLLGVDYSVDALMVSRNRAADLCNIISDKGGLPEKRDGYRTLHQLSGTVHGIYYGFLSEEEVFIAHVGGALYRFDESENPPVLIADNIANSRSTAFFMGHEGVTKLFLLTGEDLLVYDGNELKNITEIAVVPLIIISKNPNGTGGVALEGVNLITPFRRESFLSDGSSTVYQLSAKEIDSDIVTVSLTTSTETEELVENTDFTVNRQSGQITFNTAPEAPEVSGRDNVEIRYAKTVPGYADRIKKCTASVYYGLGSSGRMFLTGNSDYPAWDFWCKINDPTYFPDLNYGIVGSESTAVMGYAKLGEDLLIIKEDNQQDSTIFVRSAELLDGETIFPVKQGVTGIGAVAQRSFVNLIDEPLFLSRSGVYAVTSNIITAERTLQNRSYFIDAKLTLEENLASAVACEWNGYYLLALNERVYLLNSRQKSGSGSSFLYECYFWDNFPAHSLLSHKGFLYFGTVDGRICKLNTDILTIDRYSDDGKAIKAFWDTPADDDGSITLLKNLEREGGMLTIKPSASTSAVVYVSVDGEPWEKLSEGKFSLISWENLSFNSFSFFTTSTPKHIYFNQKLRRYLSLQFRVQNDKVNQSFGIYEISKYFTYQNYGK